MISQTGLSKSAQAILNLIDHGQCVVDGQEIELPLYKTEVDGSSIRVYLYLNNTTEGPVTVFRLLDRDGEVFDERPESTEKPATKGLLRTFEYEVKEV